MVGRGRKREVGAKVKWEWGDKEIGRWEIDDEPLERDEEIYGEIGSEDRQKNRRLSRYCDRYRPTEIY